LASFSTLFCGIVGSVVLENYGWRYTFQLIGVMSLLWVLFFRNNVVLKSRAKLNMLNAKESMLNPEDPGILLNPSNIAAGANSLPSSNNSVPWMEILNKPAFWSLIVAHVCQNNAYYILLTWLPTYFQENYPGSRVRVIYCADADSLYDFITTKNVYFLGLDI
jgi:ACS family sodium-dependent inorganic phosphate cotransporter-like MFS transporter 9